MIFPVLFEYKSLKFPSAHVEKRRTFIRNIWIFENSMDCDDVSVLCLHLMSFALKTGFVDQIFLKKPE